MALVRSVLCKLVIMFAVCRPRRNRNWPGWKARARLDERFPVQAAVW